MTELKTKKQNQLNANPVFQTDDVMKCLYLGLARRNKGNVSYIYSLIIMRDAKGQYPIKPQISVEMFEDKHIADLAYKMKEEICDIQRNVYEPLYSTMKRVCQGEVLDKFYALEKECR